MTREEESFQREYDSVIMILRGVLCTKGKDTLYMGKRSQRRRKAMTELKYRLEHGLFVERKKITLNEWFDTWMEEYKNNQVKIGTCINYREYYKNNIKDVLGNKDSDRY